MAKSQKQAAPIEDDTYENVLKSMVKDGGVRGWVIVDWQGIPVKFQVLLIFMFLCNIFLCVRKFNPNRYTYRFVYCFETFD